MPEKPPAFQCYVKDWLTEVASMTHAETSAFVRLAWHCWLSDDCDLPDDDRALQRLAGMDARNWHRVAAKLQQRMTATRDGHVSLTLILDQRRKQLAFSEMQSKKGKVGAKRRWSGHAPAMAEGWPKDGSSSPDSSNPPIVPLSESDIAKFRKAYPKSDRLRAIVVETEYVEALERGHSHEEIMAGVERMKRSGRAMRYMPAAPDFLRENRFLDDWPSQDSEAEEPIEEVWARRHPPEPEWMKGRGPWSADWTEEEEAERQRKLKGAT